MSVGNIHRPAILRPTGQFLRCHFREHVLGVAWADKIGPDEIYQSTLRVDNIHLLKEHEAPLLQDADTAKNWFGTIYQDRVVTKIARALKRLKRAEIDSVSGEAPCVL